MSSCDTAPPPLFPGSQPPSVADVHEADRSDPGTHQAAAILAFGRRISAQPETSILVQDALAMATGVLQADLSGIGTIVGKDGLALRIGRTNPGGEYVECARRELGLSSKLSMAGYALRAAAPIASSQLDAEQRFTDLFLRELGVASGITVPMADGSPLGTLGLYWKTPRPFVSPEVCFAETIAHMLAAALARDSAKSALQRGQMLTDTLLDVLDDAVILVVAQGNVMGVNRAGCELTGFSREEIHGRPFLEVFIPLEEHAPFQAAFSQALSQPGAAALESSLVTKSNLRHRLGWTLRSVGDPLGRTDAVVLRGICIPAAQPRVGRGPAPIATPGGLPQKERRLHPRRAYSCRQLIAPMRGDTLPQKSDFFSVECKDISAGGVAFYYHQVPDFKTLVVALGHTSEPAYFFARVVYAMEQPRNTGTVYVVGCHFTGRLRGNAAALTTP